MFCIIGDGSAGLNFSEFHTGAKNNLPITVVINNDKQWGMSKHGQEIMWGKGRHVATELGMVHYEKAAAGLGANGELVERAEDIAPAMKRALAARASLPQHRDRFRCRRAGHARDVQRGRAEEARAIARQKPVESEGTTLPYYGKRKLE